MRVHARKGRRGPAVNRMETAVVRIHLHERMIGGLDFHAVNEDI